MRRIILLVMALLLTGFVASAQDDLPTGVQIDQPIPAISGVDLAGNAVDVASFTGKRTVVLSFWSIYCTDCVKELDDLRVISTEFPEDEVAIIAVNTDSSVPLSRITSFIRRYEGVRGSTLDVIHLLDRDGSVVNNLGVRYIPLMITVGKGGVVTSVLSGYRHEQDKSRLVQALEDGRIATGAWSEGLRGRLRTILRSSGPSGQVVEWGAFRVEEGMSLFGLYNKDGWSCSLTGQTNRDVEVDRVECVVRGRLKFSLMREALQSLGFRVAQGSKAPYQEYGIEIPECALDIEQDRLAKLYKDLEFDSLYAANEQKGLWVGDRFWSGLVGDVDLAALREKMKDLGLASSPMTIELITNSDFDFKPRAVLKELTERSYRVSSIRDDRIIYYGNADKLVEEIMALNIKGLEVFAEKLEDSVVRLESF
ncbi:TlpA family protein disulfide reductase [bacterium]|nr:MAG: TlpA family protein disulfide reductase [bacterium]